MFFQLIFSYYPLHVCFFLCIVFNNVDIKWHFCDASELVGEIAKSEQLLERF